MIFQLAVNSMRAMEGLADLAGELGRIMSPQFLEAMMTFKVVSKKVGMYFVSGCPPIVASLTSKVTNWKIKYFFVKTDAN